MQNGYALATEKGLGAIRRHLENLSDEGIDLLRSKLSIGIHRDVEITEKCNPGQQIVSQAFCSALPVAYSNIPSPSWEAFASLVLEAAYEATMWAAVLNAQRRVSNVVFLTLLGGGAFGNQTSWITSAMHRAFKIVESYSLDVKLVTRSEVPKEVQKLLKQF